MVVEEEEEEEEEEGRKRRWWWWWWWRRRRRRGASRALALIGKVAEISFNPPRTFVHVSSSRR